MTDEHNAPRARANEHLSEPNYEEEIDHEQL